MMLLLKETYGLKPGIIFFELPRPEGRGNSMGGAMQMVGQCKALGNAKRWAFQRAGHFKGRGNSMGWAIHRAG